MITLDRLPVGARGCIVAVRGEPALVQRLMELGVFEGEDVELLGAAPLGDPLEIRIGAGRLSLRKTEAACIEVNVLVGG